MQQLSDEELIKATLDLLKNRSVRLMLRQIAADIDVTYEWICKFHQGFYLKNPPEHKKVISKVERLNKYLVSKLNPTLP